MLDLPLIDTCSVHGVSVTPELAEGIKKLIKEEA